MEKPLVLQVLHNYRFPAGTELFTEQLVHSEELRNTRQVVAFPSRGGFTLVDDSDEDVAVPFPPGAATIESALERAFVEILIRLRPKIVHFQHFINIPASLPFVAKKTGAVVALNIHDQFLLCRDPHVEGRLGSSIDTCLDLNSCLAHDCSSRGTEDKDTAKDLHAAHRRAFAHIVSAADAVVAPSVFASKIAKALGSKATIIPHGLSETFQFRQRTGRVRKIGFIGSVYRKKGAALLIDAFSKIKDNETELHLFGHVEPSLAAEDHPGGVFFHGEYRRSDLPDLTRDIDLGVIPSLVPESYCYTLDELSMMGIPTLVSDCGALSERVLPEMVFRPTVDELSAKLRTVLEDEGLRAEAARFGAGNVRSLSMQASDYAALYDFLLAPAVGRNEPCPCGSGKKYKKCHG